MPKTNIEPILSPIMAAKLQDTIKIHCLPADITIEQDQYCRRRFETA